jgi:hypothetical protein
VSTRQSVDNGLNDGVPLLGAYAAKTCARRIHNDFDATIPKVEWEPSAEMQRMFDEGVEFEAGVLVELANLLGSGLVSIQAHRSREESVRLTLDAMSAGALMISNGWLPDDREGGRQGRPDLLLLVIGGNGAAFYVPGDIKAHKTLNEPGPSRHSFRYRASQRVSSPGYSAK